MSIPREGSRDIGEGIIVSLTPDVCKTPVGSSMVPVPYSITAKQADDANTVATVRMTKKRAHNMASLVTKSTGDAPGTGTGIKSGTVGSVCHPKTHSGTVRIRGEYAIRDADMWEMNNRNTVGKLTYVRSKETFGETPAVTLFNQPTLEAPALIAGGDGADVLLGQSAGDFLLDPGVETPPRPGIEIPSEPQLPAENSPNRIAGEPSAQPEPPPPSENRWVRRMINGAWRVTKGGLIFTPARELFLMQNSPNAWRDEMWHDFGDPAQEALLDTADEAIDAGADRQEVSEWLRREIEVAREERRQAEAEVTPEDVRITREEQEQQERDCLVGEYQDIVDECDGEAHHIVPDMAYRLGRRRGASPSSTANRVPNAPTLNEGMAICLTPTQHGSGPNGIHGRLRGQLNDLGDASPVAGTAPMGQILGASLAEIAAIPDLPAACKTLAATRATEQVQSTTGMTAPGRTREAPLPSGEAARVLSAGTYN